jgi:uncharacterized membrane protein
MPARRAGRQEGSHDVVGADAAFEARSVTGEMVHQSFSFRSSPYPTPQELREYEEIHPGFTDRMLALTERETSHRIEDESLQTRATIELAKRGQVLAFVVVMTLGGGGIASILTGHSITGLAGLVVAAATLVGAFVAPNVFARRLARREVTPAPEAGTASADLPTRLDGTS